MFNSNIIKKAEEEIDVNLLFIDHDNKRIVKKLEMIHKEKKHRLATSEILSVYVDLKVRKVTQFEKERLLLIDEFIELNKKEFDPGKLTLISKLKK